MSAIDHKVIMRSFLVNDYFVLAAKCRNHSRFGSAWIGYSRIIRAARICVKGPGVSQSKKQNVTISLDTRVVMKAKILAAKRSTSISGMLADQVEALVNEDEAREQAIARSLARLRRGFDLGGGTLVSRDSLHER